MTDAVEKDFGGVGQTILIQDEEQTRNLDSRIHLLDSFVSNSNSTGLMR
jgi:hypothetical protein